MLSISQRIADELSVRESQVASAIAMLDEGSTVPFIDPPSVPVPTTSESPTKSMK